MKYALITGGTRGIGLGIARSLANEGYALALNGVRKEQEVVEVINELKSLTSPVIYCQGNIGEENDRHSILEKVMNEYGQLDILVNNAGVAPKQRQDILDTTEDSYDHVMDINLKGTFFLTQQAAKIMLLHKEENDSARKCIINISSVSATFASTNRAEYCISKAGMSMITSLFATRLAKHDIPVFEIRPGLIATDMTSGVKEKYDKLIANGLTLQPRWGTPEDVGKALVSLVKEQLAYSTGQVIMVDGGLSIQRL
ncbi:3-ketoacyl-ACP reductase [Fulvivirgaceae bacterium BMA10]|uniref:3-ketoacyl-ACP reductase n=1 Tax=Splendidivirga corallicola TaxID=3051826 RepID=A0ABT8KQQ5_9BACT|nr:3-ketoacyl-ACP reductase [Fulvivirgaceae bacterium BMA10]